MYIDLGDSARSAGRPSLWSTWFTFDGSNDADPLRLADKLGQLDAQVVDLQREGIATPTVTVEVECFLAGDGKGMCGGHTKLKCRCWHCDVAFEEVTTSVPVVLEFLSDGGLSSAPFPQHVGDQVFVTGPYHHQLQIWVPFENVVEDVAEAP